MDFIASSLQKPGGLQEGPYKKKGRFGVFTHAALSKAMLGAGLGVCIPCPAKRVGCFTLVACKVEMRVERLARRAAWQGAQSAAMPGGSARQAAADFSATGL